MRKILSRRTFLHGAGGALIGLPFLEEMRPRSARAQDAGPPMRLITMFFGLGIDRQESLKKFSGPLEAYKPFESKMSFFTNLECKHAHDFGSGEPHFKVGDVTFVGDPQRVEYEASGPSLEQLVKKQLHPDGVPTLLGTKSIGMWFRTGSVSQFTRHWNWDGSPGERPERRPTRIFEQFFGGRMPTTPGAMEDPAAVAERHMKRSVLDNVIAEYKHYTGDASPLGADSKAKLSVHLDNIRNVEMRLAPVDAAVMDAMGQENKNCQPPTGVTDPGMNVNYDLAQGGAGGSAPIIQWEDFAAAFKLQGELMALALRCDVLRFGSMLFVGSGDHVGFRGTYNALGGSLNFSQDLPGTSPHDFYFHNNKWDKCRLHAHLCNTNLATALQAMDDPNYLESNGKTLLDNTLVVLGTDYGGGGTGTGHNPDGIFHALVGGNGHFKPGWYDKVYNIIDLYDTALKPYGVASGMGQGRHKTYRHKPVEISEVLA
ncbi:MAG TPA: DUF1552 domain-containing protein [Polyangiaceae bacterium]|nr:DUF1552 domain-containing protein [Polyangiaceae bacterium]